MKMKTEEDIITLNEFRVNRVKIYSFSVYSKNIISVGEKYLNSKDERDFETIKPLYACTARSRISETKKARLDISLKYLIFDERLGELLEDYPTQALVNGFGWRSEKQAIDFNFSVSFERREELKSLWEATFGLGTFAFSEISLDELKEKYKEECERLKSLGEELREAKSDIEKLRSVIKKYCNYPKYDFKGLVQKYCAQVGAESDLAEALVVPFFTVEDGIRKALTDSGKFLKTLLERQAIEALPVAIETPMIQLTVDERKINDLVNRVALLKEFIDCVSSEYKMAEKAVEKWKAHPKYAKIFVENNK